MAAGAFADTSMPQARVEVNAAQGRIVHDRAVCTVMSRLHLNANRKIPMPAISASTPATAAITLIHTYYAAFNRGDWAAMLACLSDDVAHDLNQGARETGRTTFAAFLARMERCYAEQLQDIVIFASDDGTRAAAEYVVHGQYKVTDEGLPAASGQRYILPGGAFFSLHDGRITRVSNYYNLADWLRQVGAAAS